MTTFLIIGGLVVLFLAVVWSSKTAYHSTWSVPVYHATESLAIAAELQRRAAAAPILFTWYGVVLGAMAFGFFAPQRLVMFSVIGGICGGTLGFYLGQLHAVSLRAKAQALLCQMKIEENTRGGDRHGET